MTKVKLMLRTETDMFVSQLNLYHNNLHSNNYHHNNHHYINDRHNNNHHYQDVFYEIFNMKIFLMRKIWTTPSIKKKTSKMKLTMEGWLIGGP